MNGYFLLKPDSKYPDTALHKKMDYFRQCISRPIGQVLPDINYKFSIVLLNSLSYVSHPTQSMNFAEFR